MSQYLELAGGIQAVESSLGFDSRLQCTEKLLLKLVDVLDVGEE